MIAGMAPTLVVVGDDASFRYLIQRYAKKVACQVRFLYLIDDIVAAVLREAPYAVMVELDAPDERGRAALHALRLHPDTQQIPVIACSWTDEPEAALEAGAAHFVQKPILYDDFRAALMDIRYWSHLSTHVQTT
jgi:CheY-like chemotaxis protein